MTPQKQKAKKSCARKQLPDKIDPAMESVIPVEIKNAAFRMYISTNRDIYDIAEELSIPPQTVARWAKDGKWRKKRNQLELEVLKTIEDEYRRLVVERRQDFAQRQLTLSEQLENIINTTLTHYIEENKPVSSLVLKRLAEALAAAASVSAKILGINEKATAIVNELSDAPEGVAANDSGQAKIPLVFVGVQPVVPSKNEEQKPIDISVEEIKEGRKNEQNKAEQKDE